ncbi:PREDICTED: testis- and ovary-specific PAZ domain-containing protein 1-like, partial [Buceros rhinoceros silvestris]|uniref:testis- and ovary-specific PAZ domain-containing protein 1-like n=1 Tax=Buceros rhinoceros silvestris TaxID=175836 RepID=UPI000528E2F6
MILKRQIPDLNINVGTQVSLTAPKPQEKVDTPEKLDGCSLIGTRKPETQEKGKRCLSKKGEVPLMKLKLQGRRERDSSVLLELHTWCLESKKGAVSLRERKRNTLLSQQVKSLSGQEQPTTRGKMHKSCMKDEQQSSNPQKGAGSLGKIAKEKWKAVEQDSSTQAVKKLKTNRNRSEDCKEKEPHCCKSPPFATLGGTQSKSFLYHPVTKKSGVLYEKRNHGTDHIKCSQSFSVTTAEKVKHVSAKCDTEHCRSPLNYCTGLLCATEKNPFVRLEACSYIDRFVKSSVSGTTSSYKLSGFFHVAQDKGKPVFPDGSLEQSDMNCSTSKMQNERPPIKKGGLLVNKEKTQNGGGYFSCCQSESSKCFRGKKRNIGRKPRKKMKITEKSAMQNVFTDRVDECSECELQTEAAVAMSSSFAILGLNHKEITQSADCTSEPCIGKNTHEAQKSVRRKNSTKLLAFEDAFKKISELSTIAKRENSNSVAHHSAVSGSLRDLAQVHDVSDHHRSKTVEKFNKVNKKLQEFTCQRTVPMTGKNVWSFKSCARASEWVPKNHRSISEGKRLLRAAFEESSDKSSAKVVGNSAVTGNLRHLDLHMSAAAINEESLHRRIDPSTECLTSLGTQEFSSMDIYETLRNSNENVGSPVNVDRSAVAFNHDDAQEVKTSLNFATKQKCNTKGISFIQKASVVDQTFADLKLVKVLNTGNLTKFKIPLCRNKPESRKLESIRSFERKTCSPLELLDISSVRRRQKTGEETSLVNAEQQPLPLRSDAVSTASTKKKEDEINIKDFKHDGSENLSNEMSLYPHPFLQLESSVPDFRGTECVLKSNFHDHSWNAVDNPVALQTNDDSKSRENLSNHKSQNFPDILEAYEEDVLVIDVIQDDPDLFGTSNEKELALGDSGNCPVKASCTTICFKDKKQDLEPEYSIISENRDSVDDNFRHNPIQESGMSNDAENACDCLLEAKDIKTHNSSRGSSPLGDVTEDFLEDEQLRELGELLKSFDVDEKDSHSVQQILEKIELPRKYCRFYFTTLRGCERTKCWFWHVPEQGDEKICMAILGTYISTKETGLLKRAVQIFVKYYGEFTPGLNFASQVMNNLLISLLKNYLLQEVFQILNITVRIITLPDVDVLLKVFDHVAALNIRDAVPTLISTFCKLIDAGMFLEIEHFDCIIKCLQQLQVSSQEINTVLNIKSRYDCKFAHIYPVPYSQHCKEKGDWTKMGTSYVNARTGCVHFDDLQKLSLYIAEVLTRASETDRPGVPFCDFADA